MLGVTVIRREYHHRCHGCRHFNINVLSVILSFLLLLVVLSPHYLGANAEFHQHQQRQLSSSSSSPSSTFLYSQQHKQSTNNNNKQSKRISFFKRTKPHHIRGGGVSISNCNSNNKLENKKGGIFHQRIASKGSNNKQHPKRRRQSRNIGNQNKGVDADDPNLLILIRILFFTYYASLGSLLPYLPVYYHSLGHGGQVIGMLGAIKPFTTFLVAPLWGIISDSTSSPFKVLYFTFLVSLIGQLLVAFRHDPPWIMTMVFITALFNAPGKFLFLRVPVIVVVFLPMMSCLANKVPNLIYEMNFLTPSIISQIVNRLDGHE
jgi:hypothetical protein